MSGSNACILGCEGLSLTAGEKAFFRDANPLGFILFARNIDDPDQVRALVNDLRETVGRADAPILIDQEGGRVARLQPPHWPTFPPAAAFSTLFLQDPDRAVETATLNATLMAYELRQLGITVDCAPVVDLPQADADPIIGDRAAGTTPHMSSTLGRAVCNGLTNAGITPVIKHIPGHGRALVDSHKDLPVVDAGVDELSSFDFAPFKDLANQPWAMTAHVVYTAIDADAPATTSAKLIRDVIRQDIGFNGILVSDDLSMHALNGGFRERAEAALKAGCDLALHCNGRMAEMVPVVEGCQPMTKAANERFALGERARKIGARSEIDLKALQTRYTEIMGNG